ncbi:hypothetical protein [Arthrobacter sp. H-02-3]|uniref:hypothetical protein n=1 Tax=Arthrobacter sp. H-02-3 TaxID=2703675 RepID=UPI001057B067|nr:hypothetical protein [Arthrobacter sp. H-02-3]
MNPGSAFRFQLLCLRVVSDEASIETAMVKAQRQDVGPVGQVPARCTPCRQPESRILLAQPKIADIGAGIIGRTRARREQGPGRGVGFKILTRDIGN